MWIYPDASSAAWIISEPVATVVDRRENRDGNELDYNRRSRQLIQMHRYPWQMAGTASHHPT